MKTLIYVCLFTGMYGTASAQQTTDLPGQPSATSSRHAAPWWVERFRISAGFFIPLNNTEIKVGNEAGTFGTTIDFENDLGFSSTTSTFLGNAQWRISKRSRLDLSYYTINRTSSHLLQKDIEFADTTYRANAQVAAFLNNRIFQFSYGYAIISRPRYELGLMLGAHVLTGDIGMGVTTSAGSISGSKQFTFTTPLPDIGMWGGYAFSNRLSLNGGAGFLSVKTDNVAVSIFTYDATLTYKAGRHFLIAAGYTGLYFDVDITVKKLQGFIKWGYNGPSLSVSYVFGKRNWEVL